MTLDPQYTIIFSYYLKYPFLLPHFLLELNNGGPRLRDPRRHTTIEIENSGIRKEGVKRMGCRRHLHAPGG